MKLDALAFGAHADDVELACSGTILKLGALGYKTGVIALTQGEMATRGSVEIRAQEFAQSAKTMELSAHKMLDIPDGRIEDTWENKLKIIDEIRTHRPRILFAPYWISRHPDHDKTSSLIREAAYLSGLKKLETEKKAYRPYKIIYYQTRFDFKPTFIVDISEFQEKKMKAILCYKSQFHHQDKEEFGKDETQISSPEFLSRIEARDRHYGTLIGVKFGEPFLVREAIRINDPVDFFDEEYLGTIP